MKLNKELFEPLLNTKFTITFDSENKYEVELVEMKVYDIIPSLQLEPFTLTFRGEKTETIFAQRLYEVHSEATGILNLFLVPRMPDKEGVYYDVIFN